MSSPFHTYPCSDAENTKELLSSQPDDTRKRRISSHTQPHPGAKRNKMNSEAEIPHSYELSESSPVTPFSSHLAEAYREARANISTNTSPALNATVAEQNSGVARHVPSRSRPASDGAMKRQFADSTFKLVEVVIPLRTGGKGPVGELSKDVAKPNSLATALSDTFFQNTHPYDAVAASVSASTLDVPTPHKISRLTRGRHTKIGIASATYRDANTAPQAQPTQPEIDELLDTHVASVTTSLAPNSAVESDVMETGRLRMNTRFVMSTPAPDNRTRITESVYANFETMPSTMFLHRLERMFGVGRTDRGVGAKPPRHRRINGEEAFLHIANASAKTGPPSSTTSGTVSTSSKRSRSPYSVSAHGLVSTEASSIGDDDGVDMEDAFEKVDDVLKQMNIPEAWVSALQKLVKGKVQMGYEDMEAINQIIQDIIEAQDRIDVNALKESRLWDSMMQIALTDEIPFDDEFHVKAEAEGITEFWRSKYASESF